jgi:transposase-like protein
MTQKQTRRKFSAAFKAKVAFEVVKSQLTLAELAKKFEVNQVVIARWKALFLENMSAAFERTEKTQDSDAKSDELFAEIGKLRMENEFLKKFARNSVCSGTGQIDQSQPSDILCTQAVRAVESTPRQAVLYTQAGETRKPENDDHTG